MRPHTFCRAIRESGGQEGFLGGAKMKISLSANDQRTLCPADTQCGPNICFCQFDLSNWNNWYKLWQLLLDFFSCTNLQSRVTVLKICHKFLISNFLTISPGFSVAASGTLSPLSSSSPSSPSPVSPSNTSSPSPLSQCLFCWIVSFQTGPGLEARKVRKTGAAGLTFTDTGESLKVKYLES